MAEYLKIWLESGLEEVKVPKDESNIMKILPELKELKERIDRIISDHISSIISQTLQKKIFYKSCRGNYLNEIIIKAKDSAFDTFAVKGKRHDTGN